MARPAPEFEQVQIDSPADLWRWLETNHDRGESAWLVTWKAHTGRAVPMGEIIDMALCWGWVDSRTRGVDADRTAVLISPRRPGSAWSRINKDKVARLEEAGRMQPPGRAAVEAARANGMWSFLDDVERLEVPDDLATALGPHRAAWEAYPRSVKRGALEWIKTARTEKTRARRIEDVARSAAEGLRPSPFRRG